jgi:membrane protease YdiL (CAAX protease family)
VPEASFEAVAAEAGIGIAAAGIVLVLTTIGERLPITGDLEEEFRRILGHLEPGEICLLAIASGLGEEVLFRGALQPLLGYVLASILFGLVHTGPGRKFLPWTLFALGVGFFFGAVVMWRQCLLPVIVAHTVVNGVNLVRISQHAVPETGDGETGEFPSDRPEGPV